jgi:NAD(P)-dependent dehydrogenase (short-subunit alcohol dehydrogenase family)
MMPVALVTAGHNRMGQGTARCLIDLGWHVVLAGSESTQMVEIVEELGGGSSVSVKTLECTNLDDCKRIAAEVVNEHGGVDALVNLGSGQRRLSIPRTEFVESKPGDWQKIIDGNLRAVMNSCYAALPYMVEAKKGGAIINMTANKGLRGGPNNAVYSAAKAGVVLFGQALAQEVGEHKIRVNAVTPGAMESPGKTGGEESEAEQISPLGRPTAMRELGDMIAFLLSDEADFITGCCLDCSGGVALH